MAACTRQDLFYAINTHYSPVADTLVYYLTFMGQAEVIIPVLLLLFIFRRFRNLWYFFAALLCNIVPFFVEQFLKAHFHTPRPKLLYYDRLWVHYSPDWPYLLHNGFPSGHSEGAFSLFCFLSLLLPAKCRGWGLVFFLLALSVCYSRIYLAAHFFEDVYAGSIIGVVFTTVIFSLMNKYKTFFFFRKNTFM